VSHPTRTSSRCASVAWRHTSNRGESALPEVSLSSRHVGLIVISVNIWRITSHGFQPTSHPASALPVIDSDRFRVLHPLDSRGIGRVYVADDEELNREVALKQLRCRYADDSRSRSRLLLEAEVTARLEHPGVGPVYGPGQDERPRSDAAVTSRWTRPWVARMRGAPAVGVAPGAQAWPLNQGASRWTVLASTHSDRVARAWRASRSDGVCRLNPSLGNRGDRGQGWVGDALDLTTNSSPARRSTHVLAAQE